MSASVEPGSYRQADAWAFYWDGDRLGAEVLPDGRLRLYVYADDETLVPMLALEYADAEPSTTRVYALHSDHRGAIERVEDDAGEVVWDATVHPYGELDVHLGADFHQPFRLVGQYTDPEIGLSCNRFRYWSPELGRFLQSDPLGLAGRMNLYGWPGCPLVISDPLRLGCPGAKKKADAQETGVDAESTPVDGAEANRAENIAQGIPASALGPSGKPKIHIKKHRTRKRAADAALARSRRGGTSQEHSNPAVGDPHFHPDGSQHREHHTYPRKGFPKNEPS